MWLAFSDWTLHPGDGRGGHARGAGEHAAAALAAALDATAAAAAPHAAPAAVFAADQARSLAARLLVDGPGGPASPAVLEALVLDALSAQYIGSDGGAVARTPSKAVRCKLNR